MRAPDGALLRFRGWDAATPRAALLVVHGLGDHGGRYAGLAAALVPRGVSVAALDLRGHGRSEGQRGHLGRFSDYVADVEAFRRAVAGPLPLFLFGHSMGGLVAIRWLQAHPEVPLRGVVLSAPALGLVETVPAWKRALAATLERTLPFVPFPSGIRAEDLSHDPAAHAAYRADTLVHDRITPRLYFEMLRAMDAARAERAAIRPPVLLLVPEADPVVRADAALAFARGSDFTVRPLPGLYHEWFNEPERAAIFAGVAEWIEAKTS